MDRGYSGQNNKSLIISEGWNSGRVKLESLTRSRIDSFELESGIKGICNIRYRNIRTCFNFQRNISSFAILFLQLTKQMRVNFSNRCLGDKFFFKILFQMIIYRI